MRIAKEFLQKCGGLYAFVSLLLLATLILAHAFWQCQASRYAGRDALQLRIDELSAIAMDNDKAVFIGKPRLINNGSTRSVIGNSLDSHIVYRVDDDSDRHVHKARITSHLSRLALIESKTNIAPGERIVDFRFPVDYIKKDAICKVTFSLDFDVSLEATGYAVCRTDLL